MARDSKKHKFEAKIYPFVPTGEYYFHKGLKAYDRFDVHKAIKYLKRALELEPYEPTIACQLALVYTEAGEYSLSNQLLLDVIEELDPKMTECHYFLANNYAHLNMVSEAYYHASKYLELDQLGEFAEDVEELLEWIGMDAEKHPEIIIEEEDLFNRQELAKQIMEEGDFVRAVKLLEEIVEDHPEFWPAQNNLALAYFYEGATGRAFHMTKKVLAHNEGNLHALCNLAVFYYYEKKTEELEKLLSGLEKVQPLILEHRYKLGATFALTGRYDKAYYWLKQLHNRGFDGNAGFYYWLAKSAYFSGHEQAAKKAWEHLSLIEPQHAGTEPWNEDDDGESEDAANDRMILKMLNSERPEERLYGIFNLSKSPRKREILTHPEFDIDAFSMLEKIYLAHILHLDRSKTMDMAAKMENGHKTALLLFENNKNGSLAARSLLLKWFHLFQKMIQTDVKWTNPAGFAAAVDYIWLRERDEKKTQNEIAKSYNISAGTLRRYMKVIERFLSSE